MSYVDLHPSHWTVRADIFSLAERLTAQHECTWNTYYDHPPGYGRDYTSVDFWGPAGRGDPIGKWPGFSVWGHIFYDPNPPLIDWIIWQGWIWTRAGGWSWYSEDEPYSDAGHFRHVHVTFMED